MKKLNNLKIFRDKYDMFGVQNCNCKCRQCRYEFDCRSSSEDYKNIRQHEIDKEILEEILEGSSEEFLQSTIALVKKVRVNHPDFIDVDASAIYERILGAIEVLDSLEEDKEFLVELACEINVRYSLIENMYKEMKVLHKDYDFDDIFTYEVIEELVNTENLIQKSKDEIDLFLCDKEQYLDCITELRLKIPQCKDFTATEILYFAEKTYNEMYN